MRESRTEVDHGGAAEVPTVRDRLLAAHISETRIQLHHEARAITLDGQLVTDLDSPAPHGTRINFAGR